jgi:hypothetical protein
MERVKISSVPKTKKSAKRQELPEALKGWKAIGAYLGIGAATAQRWAKSGMPVKREGRYTIADSDEIRRWLGRETHMPAPAHVLTPNADISAALKESISAVRRRKRSR